jgi:hypothetical protein
VGEFGKVGEGGGCRTSSRSLEHRGSEYSLRLYRGLLARVSTKHVQASFVYKRGISLPVDSPKLRNFLRFNSILWYRCISYCV